MGTAVKLFIAGIFALAMNHLSASQESSPIQHTDTVCIPGAERTEEYLPLLRNKKVALAGNHSSMIGRRRMIDSLLARGVSIVRVFSPEHGLYGKVAANTPVEDHADPVTHIQVISLFGHHQKPKPEELRGIDAILFDMQDVGVRFYTYISTLHYIMEACAEASIPVIILDRPNPNDGYIDGPVLYPRFKSFIGMHPVPIVHGMTIGEYARMINGEGWLRNRKKCSLTVIPVGNYRHGQSFDFKQPPSPNLNTPRSVFLYPSLCWFGATAVSDARGTFFPFQAIGSPLLKGKYDFAFTPKPITGMAERPAHANDTCYGIDLRNYPRGAFGIGGRLNLQWLLEMYKSYPEKALFFNGENAKSPDSILHFDYLVGNSLLREQIKRGFSEPAIRQTWEAGLKKYRKIRSKYLLYADPPAAIKVMTWNIHHGADKDEQDRLSHMASLINSSGAGIVGLQEVDSVCSRSDNMDQAAILASMTGMHHLFQKHFAFQGGAYGNALLSRYPIGKVSSFRLPILSDSSKTVAFFVADLHVSKKTMVKAAVVHMDYRDSRSRINQANMINRIIEKTKCRYLILTGDMNASPGTAEVTTLTKYLKDVTNTKDLTFPAGGTDRKIDYILSGKGLWPLSSYVLESTDSDHLPVISVLDLRLP
ncbi:exo-beta-N-acetylmuramidase NamZ domain-containing protein [Pararcticibacter amylolyticus]|uniref:Uncharacterized protein n=1 Tax=Pararcticibacter amylolyticus TaxID=2173175 RepID=A0A2U2PJC0_9SPHI|nr:exo-beta-N-acetylmuramidase NamZ domain-containing protein [Pararcticibacter amylolyticus]PWG81491.1 hypothetical protein DDR33_06580 [Pararcticibacter amylolyticus]